MFSAERYLTEYLRTRSNFTSYSKTFLPSTELFQSDFYQSPLTEDAPQTKFAAKQQTKTAAQPIVDLSEYSDENINSILDIAEDIPLQSIVEKLNKNNE